MTNTSNAEPRKLGSNLAWVAVAQGLNFFLVGFATLPALTKSYSAEIYGVWVQTYTTVVLLAPALSLQLGVAVVRFLSVQDEAEKRRQSLGAMLWLVLGFACVALFLAVLLKRELSMLLFASPQYGQFAPLAILWGTMEALLILLTYYLRARDNMKTVALVQMTLAVVKMALIVTMSRTGHSLETVLVSVIAVEAFFVVLVLGIIVRELGWLKPSRAGLGGYLAFSLPQIPVGALLWMINASSRYFIAHLISLYEAGIYSASYTLGSLLLLFLDPITFVVFPVLARYWEQNERVKVATYLEYSTRLYLVLAIPAAVGLCILSQPLLRVLATSEYAVGGLLVALITLGLGLSGIFQINVSIIFLVKKTKYLPLMTGLAAAANVGINLALLPTIGLTGAAISTVVSYFLLAAIVTIWAGRAVGYRFDWVFLFKIVLAAAVMGACLTFIPVSGVLGIILAAVVGVTVFGVMLLVLRAFGKRDLDLIKQTLSGVIPVPLLKRIFGRDTSVN